MESKIYTVAVKGELPIFCDSKSEAEMEAELLSTRLNKEVSVFGRILCVKPKDTNERIDSYEAALTYLGHSDASQMVPSGEHAKAMKAMYKLITIAEAWNKADGFVPDFSNRNQYKWFPWFVYNSDVAGFVCSYSTSAPSDAAAYFGSRLCFKDKLRAEQFGRQFIGLWNDFFLT